MAIYGYTKNYKLIKPQFDTDTWHDYVYDNLDTIDAIMSAIYFSGNWQGFWKKNTHYDVGDVVIDQDTDTMYKVMVEHTTSENTFALEQAAHPTYYELWSPNDLAESWAIKMDGLVSYTDYSAKAYAISSSLIDAGSAKEWAIKSGTIGTTGEYSAKKYATDAHNDYISMTTDANVVAVGTNIASVNTVSTSISEVNTTASNIASVNTVAGDINRVNLVADDISSVHTVAVDISNVIDVAANKTNIDTVAGVATDVTTVASIATAVSTVSGIESEVLDVSDNRTDISTVASNISDVNTVAGISTDVSTVADNDTNVTTVATNISDVNTAASNMTAIQAAPAAANNAAASATLAQEWASKTDAQVASTDYSSKAYAQSEGLISSGSSKEWANKSATWAEGSDAGVAVLGGTHSAKGWTNNSKIWAEGTDFEVQALGGTHSAKVWAEQSTNANVDLSNLSATGEAHFQVPLVSGTNIKTLNNVSLLGSGNIATGETVTSKWRSGYNWYRKWSDGWIEQGGRKVLGTTRPVTLSFNTAFTTTEYSLAISNTGSSATTSSGGYATTVYSPAKTGLSIYYNLGGTAVSADAAVYWYACGY